VDAVLHLYKLYMSLADIDHATRIMQQFVVDHPDDPAAVTLLAKHYGDIQDKRAEVRTLERLFELSPSVQTARDLLA
jgi:predicted Zn-dependent protease